MTPEDTPNSTLNPNPANNPPAPPAKRRMLIIIAVVVGLGLIVTAAILLWPKNNPAGDKAGQQTPPDDEALLGAVYQDSKTNVQIRFPKGWEKTATSRSDPYAVVAYRNPQQDIEGAAKGNASSNLSVQPATAGIEAYMRNIIEASINVSLHSKLLEHKRIGVNGIPVRTISYSFPGPGGVEGRVTRYVFQKNDKFYDLSFAALVSKWDGYEPAFNATVRSVTLP